MGFLTVNNALNYREVMAQVELVERVCRLADVPAKAATSCREVLAIPGGKRIFREITVYVRYSSQADGKELSGVVMPSGGSKAVKAAKLSPGASWQILVSKINPNDIKVEQERDHTA